MKAAWVIHQLLVSLLATSSLARPLDDDPQPADNTTTVSTPQFSELPRLAIYYQTTHTHPTGGEPISMLPLVTEKGIALTHIYVCTLHIHAGGVVHLNDFPPENPRFATLWREAEVLRASGVKVMAMVGGAAEGSFSDETLDAPDGSAAFEKYYGQLRDVLREYSLQGLDIDVEQPMSQGGIARLVRRLRADFGPDFIITLAPVGTALGYVGWPNLSGFSYEQLEREEGKEIAYYNAQFYNGFGDMTYEDPYDAVVGAGYGAERVVIGQLTSPANGGQYVPFDQLKTTIDGLTAKYGTIGGVMGWEYFNGEPGGQARPWEWAQQMTKILRPNFPAVLRVTREDAAELDEAWAESVGEGVRVGKSGKPDYWSMVNA